ncbi:MAG: endonuclease [Flavobacteriales bacterium]|nr:endonuclease [Flavobacteriales bacterium]
MRNLLLLILVLQFSRASAQPPPGYYDQAQGLTGEALRAALADIISPHNVLANSQLWAAFARTDRKPDGSVWDMYSDAPSGTPPYTYQFVVNQCGSYNSEGDCFNREHTFPVSWFGDIAPMNTDLHHLYPTDAWVNQQRGNWPYGTVNSAAWTSQNGGKRGPCAWPGCTGTVFEPIDAYKGDLARAHLYMLTRYMNESASWSSPVQSSGFWLPWVESLLFTWHNQDPVSLKETARNDSVFVIQGNRNPYIDHPEWVASIWGPEATIAEETARLTRAWAVDGLLHIECADCDWHTRFDVLDCTGRVFRTLTLNHGFWEGRIEAKPGIYFLAEEDRAGAIRIKL